MELHGAVDINVVHELLTAPFSRLLNTGTDLAVRWHPNARLSKGDLADPIVRYCSGRAEGLSVHVDFGPSSDAENVAVVRELMMVLFKTKGRNGKIRVKANETDGKYMVSRAETGLRV